jgi:hypothetical protein
MSVVMTIETPDGGAVRLRQDGDRLRIIVVEGGGGDMSASVEVSTVEVNRMVLALMYFEKEVG